MCSGSLQSAIFLYELRSETLTNELIDNSMDLRLLQKHASNEIEKIHAKYSPEKQQIRNEINDLDKVEQQNEYQELTAELKDLQEKEDREVEKIENRLKDQETKIQSENEILEVQLEEINTQIESFQEMLKQNTEKEFGYFQ